MSLLDFIQHHLSQNQLLQHLTLTILFVILVPTLVTALLTTQQHRNRSSSHYSNLFLDSLGMVFEALGFSFSWGSSSGSSTGSGSSSERRKIKKKPPRTRAEQMAGNGNGKDAAKEFVDYDDAYYYPGLVNISGTYCFMNSTLQAMASLCYLQPHIDRIHAKAEVLDVPTPVIDTLRDLLYTLNTPKSRPSSYRPLEMINALSTNSPGGNKNGLFSSREHQDAQELFQLLSECIKKEAIEVDKEGHRDRGLGGLGGRGREVDVTREIGKSVFDGLTANRRSCVECGYTEAVMHFAFDNWQLAMPRFAGSCRLEDCLADYTRLEVLNDCICRKCSMIATHRRLAQEAARLTELASHDENPTSSKKRRAREARKLEGRVLALLQEGRIEEDIKGVKMEKVFSKASTKQAMIARPPSVLALHLNRSVHYGHYAAKNTCRIYFPEVLDLTPYTTSGNLSTVPSVPISSPPPAVPRSTTPTPATYAIPRTLYRLSAVVCHYGQHSFGHYICFRRKPRPVPSSSTARLSLPRMMCPLGCECEKCQRYGPVRDEDDLPVAGQGWLRVSDDSVRECGLETVLAEGSGAFMLFYERVVLLRPSPYSSPKSPRSSQDTVKPEVPLHPNGSSVPFPIQNGDAHPPLRSSSRSAPMPIGDGRERSVGPRIIRSVDAGRSRSVSVAPSPSSSPPSSRDTSMGVYENDATPRAEAPLSSYVPQPGPSRGPLPPTPTSTPAPAHSTRPQPLASSSSPNVFPPSAPTRQYYQPMPSPQTSYPSSDPRVSPQASSRVPRSSASSSGSSSSSSTVSQSSVSQSSHRSKHPQPVAPSSERPLSPVVAVGLRA
ncbi:hypothetical protein JAAARDRAFT_27735 [Jaapia argillacea MUCL 33604]|uniref:ubiquitinyl hydrolase 1 n=1 Tax=Jaapia argillacea MUCL 33604 TaxID=933084 RepID=A0A067QNA1_9AGAM|nr:hypothetical protein JAAARDRAFT_27735 [Jaapia argillacea MUCL 33604]